MRTSCVRHPKREPLIKVHQWQIEFCDGNRCAAALLSFYEYWHNIKLDMSASNRAKNDIAEAHGDNRTQDESLYQFHSQKGLESGILNMYGKTKIIEANKLLVKKKAITIHPNPNPRYKFDNTNHFLFHPEIVNKWLDNRCPEMDNGRTDTDSDNPKPDSGQPKTNEQYPETTTETSSETTTEEKNMSPTGDRVRSLDKETKETARRAISYLNRKTGKNFRANAKETTRLVRARLREGFQPMDFKTVIDKKCLHWLGTEFEDYLRPITLFGTKFESYLNSKNKRPRRKMTQGEMNMPGNGVVL